MSYARIRDGVKDGFRGCIERSPQSVGLLIYVGVAIVILAGISLVASPVVASCGVLLLILCAFLYRLPWVCLPLLLCFPETSTGRAVIGKMPWYNRLGEDVYTARLGSIPVLEIAVVGLLILARRKLVAKDLISQGDRLIKLTLLIGTVVAIVTMLEEQDKGFTALPRGFASAYPWLLFGSAYVISQLAVTEPSGRRVIALILGWALVLRTVSGLLALATTGGVTLDDQAHVALLDISAPAAGAAVILAFVCVGSRRLGQWAVLVAGSVCVIIAFRRSIFLELIVGLALVPVINRSRTAMKRTLYVVAVPAVLVLFLPFEAIRNARSRFEDIAASLTNQTPGTSATLHVNDVQIGYEIATRHFFLGLGSYAPQPPELVNFYARLIYVHNDFLQIWLRFGVAVCILHVALLVIIAARGWKVLASGRADFLAAATASVCLLAGILLFTAPFFSTNLEVPLLLGLAAAVTSHAAGADKRSVAADAKPINPVDVDHRSMRHITRHIQGPQQDDLRHGVPAARKGTAENFDRGVLTEPLGRRETRTTCDHDLTAE